MSGSKTPLSIKKSETDQQVAEKKAALRKLMREKRQKMTEEDQQIESVMLDRKISRLADLQERRSLMATYPVRGEAHALGFLKQWLFDNRKLIFPVIKSDTVELLPYQIRTFEMLIPGYRGIYEPDPKLATPVLPSEIEVILVPGLAFDFDGNRLGMGGGYFDRFLTKVSPNALLIGICWDWQLVSSLPTTGHDRPIDIIVTPNSAYDCRYSRE